MGGWKVEKIHVHHSFPKFVSAGKGRGRILARGDGLKEWILGLRRKPKERENLKYKERGHDE